MADDTLNQTTNWRRDRSPNEWALLAVAALVVGGEIVKTAVHVWGWLW